MLFWTLILIMSAISGLVIWVYFAQQLSSGAVDEFSDTQLYEVRMSEILKDIELGRMDPASADAAKAEVGRLLLNSSANEISAPLAGFDGRYFLSGTLLVFFALSISIYSMIGTPQQHFASSPEQSATTSQSLEQLLLTAEKRLADNPDDVRGWRVVAPVYIREGRFDDAINAYKNVLRLEGASGEILTLLGETITNRNNGIVDSEALMHFQDAARLERKNATATFHIGLAALQNGDQEKARAAWQSMVDTASGDENWLPIIRQRIAELDGSASKPESSKNFIDSFSEEQQSAIMNMVSGLAERLKSDPDDKEGWVRLVRAYMVLQRKEDALAAIDDARSAFPDDEELASQLTRIVEEFSNGQTSSGKAR